MTKFIEISNREVYDELQEFKDNNRSDHREIMALIGSYKAQVKRLSYGLYGIGILSLSTLGWFIRSLI